MSKPKQYANIPIGYVCVPLEEYVDLNNRIKNMANINGDLRAENDRFEKQIETLEDSLETAEAERDSARNAITYWSKQYDSVKHDFEELKKETDKLLEKNQKLRDTVSFYVPKWEEDEESCRT